LQRCHKRGLESRSRGVKPTKTHSEASPTLLEGFRGPNSDPNISDFCPPPKGPYRGPIEGVVKRSDGVVKCSGGAQSTCLHTLPSAHGAGKLAHRRLAGSEAHGTHRVWAHMAPLQNDPQQPSRALCDSFNRLAMGAAHTDPISSEKKTNVDKNVWRTFLLTFSGNVLGCGTRPGNVWKTF
jgi:hypothetical protein